MPSTDRRFSDRNRGPPFISADKPTTVTIDLKNSTFSSSDYKASTVWLLAERAVRILFVLLTNVLIARHLGPAGFGLLSFAISLVSIFVIASNLGLNDILVKQLLDKPERANITLGTSVSLVILVSVICIVANLLIAIFVAEPVSQLILLIVGVSLLFCSSMIFEAYFQAHVMGKRLAAAKFSALILGTLIKFALLMSNAPTSWFAWSVVFDSMLLLAFLIFAFQRTGNSVTNWSFDEGQAKYLLTQSWPLLLSGIFVTIYMKIDQVMIQHYLGPESVGYYSVAVQISQAWYFVPVLISASLFPAILNLRQNKDAYHLRILALYRLVCGLGIAVAIITTVFSERLVSLLFTTEYIAAADVLTIHIWAGIFVGLGMVSGKWLVAENLQRHSFYRAGWGAILNVVLNLVLIPKAGIIGAATATLAAQIFATYAYDVFRQETRLMFLMKTRALLSPLPIPERRAK